MPAQPINKPNPAKAGFLLAEKASMVWRCAGQAFNKLLLLPPFHYLLQNNEVLTKTFEMFYEIKVKSKFKTQIEA